jgi:hypothetical protein
MVRFFDDLIASVHANNRNRTGHHHLWRFFAVNVLLRLVRQFIVHGALLGGWIRSDRSGGLEGSNMDKMIDNAPWMRVGGNGLNVV